MFHVHYDIRLINFIKISFKKIKQHRANVLIIAMSILFIAQGKLKTLIGYTYIY